MASCLEEELKRARIGARQVTHREGKGASRAVLRSVYLAFDLLVLEFDERRVCLWCAANSKCHHDVLVVLRLGGVSEHLDQALDACQREVARPGVRRTLNVLRTDQSFRKLHIADLGVPLQWSHQ